jgi:hypothetical protein
MHLCLFGLFLLVASEDNKIYSELLAENEVMSLEHSALLFNRH